MLKKAFNFISKLLVMQTSLKITHRNVAFLLFFSYF